MSYRALKCACMHTVVCMVKHAAHTVHNRQNHNILTETPIKPLCNTWIKQSQTNTINTVAGHNTQIIIVWWFHWLLNAQQVCSLTPAPESNQTDSGQVRSLRMYLFHWIHIIGTAPIPLNTYRECTYSTEYILYRKCTYSSYCTKNVATFWVLYVSILYWECSYSTEYICDEFLYENVCTYFTENVPIQILNILIQIWKVYKYLIVLSYIIQKN